MAKILIVDDEKPLRDTLARWFRKSYECLTAHNAASALEAVQANPDLVLMITDVRMPDGDDGVTLMRKAKAIRPNLVVIVLTAYGTVDLAVEAMRDGADDFFQKPVTDLDQFDQRVARAVKNALLVQEADEPKLNARPTELENFTGKSAAMEKIYRLIRKVAPTNANVLVQGPSGTGKELVARALHDLSPRAQKPFIAVECAALSKDLLESELFGYAPGSFTGSLKEGKAGCFEAANGGTLFLDEIGEIDASTQIKLLRALESRTITRIGSTQTVSTDFRLITATNQDLARLVMTGQFREDLYYRLNVIDLRMPALKDRPGDIALLVTRFLEEFSAANGGAVTGIDPAALKALESYAWPGNVRQLRNVIERMVVLASTPMLTVEDLPAEITQPPMASLPTTVPPKLPTSGTTLADTEKAQILSALAACGNNKSKAADELGISRRTLHRKLKEWNLA